MQDSGCPSRSTFGYWFPSSNSMGHVHGMSVSQSLSRVLRRVGYDGHAHQARHSYGTHLLRSSGGNLRVTQEGMRHTSPATTARYTQVDDTQRRAALLGLPDWAA